MHVNKLNKANTPNITSFEFVHIFAGGAGRRSGWVDTETDQNTRNSAVRHSVGGATNETKIVKGPSPNMRSEMCEIWLCQLGKSVIVSFMSQTQHLTSLLCIRVEMTRNRHAQIHEIIYIMVWLALETYVIVYN